MSKVYVPRDSAARSVGADEVAAALAKLGHEVIRNGSRGLLFLEPLVEVETKDGRIAYGPVTVEDVASLPIATVGAHKLRLGNIEDHPYLKNQERLTFARCGITDPVSVADYVKHGGFDGLKKALGLAGAAIVAEVTESGLRGRGGEVLEGERALDQARRLRRPASSPERPRFPGPFYWFSHQIDALSAPAKPTQARCGHCSRAASRSCARSWRYQSVRSAR